MHIISLLIVLLSPLAFAHTKDECAAHLDQSVLRRGPIELDIQKSEISWSGDEDHRFVLRLQPGQLQAAHALFVAANGLRSDERVPKERIMETHQRLYPAEKIALPRLLQSIRNVNHEIGLEDEEMTYWLLSGQYKDVLNFQWNGQQLTVNEDEFTVLTTLSKKPNEAIGRELLIEDLAKADPRWNSMQSRDAMLSRLVTMLRRKFPELPIETVRDRGYRWVGPPQPEDIWKFRGFELNVKLARLIWKDGETVHELRLKPIECAVLKERFKHGDRPISWSAIAKNPTEERLKSANLGAFRVHFTNVRKRVLALTPSAESAFSAR